MTRTTFIASSSHSGSTLLELLLSSHPHCCGIGEAFQLVDPRNDVVFRVGQERCGCGRTIAECTLWGELLDSLQRGHGQCVGDGYRQIMDHIDHRYPDTSHIIDSSKTLRSLSAARETFGNDITVIHLVRDVRAWLVSTKKAERRHRQQFLNATRTGQQARGLRRLIKQSRFYHCLAWHAQNKKITTYIKEHKLRSLCVSYEQLCFRPEQSLRRITNFMQIDCLAGDRNALRGVNHNVLGNRMRYEQPGVREIVYDYRWLHSREWVLPSVLLPHVASYNRDLFQLATID